MSIVVSILAYLGLILSAVKPYVSVVIYYFSAILGPQYIWWWYFHGVRNSFLAAIGVIFAFFIKIATSRIDTSLYKSKILISLFGLWIVLALSYKFGEFVNYPSQQSLNSDQIFSLINKSYLLLFLCVPLLDEIDKVKKAFYLLSFISFVFILWANYQYFTQNWIQFNFGRLMGPTDIRGSSIYRDENTFATIVVVTIPFLFYFAKNLSFSLAKIILYFCVVLGWHAVFLTGSRGGLLSLVVISFMMARSFESKKILLLLVSAFIIFFLFQGGSSMLSRSTMIVDYEGEHSAESRIDAWKGGVNMVLSRPFLGVGLGGFMAALPHYYDTNPRVAHNTFVQYCSESGIFAGIFFILIVYFFFKNLWVVKKSTEDLYILKAVVPALNSSFCGFLICSIFLSLNYYEVFLFLVLINASLHSLYRNGRN